MKKIILLLSIVFCGFFSTEISAQDTTDLIYRPFQVSFITPLGTNGVRSNEYINELSLNVLAGYNGGLDGFEIGGLANIIEKNASGFQASGLTNIVFGAFDGAQVGGFLNLVNENSEGMQLSGFANLNGGGFNGLQASGFGNITGDSSEVVQISGFGNINDGFLEGIQMSGFINITENLQGAQVGGFMNLAEDVNGAQISGFINIAERVEGLQLSVINICDSIKGIPIGVLSIVKNGYRSFEFWGGDALNMNLAYKTGVKDLYNIFAVGGHFAGGLKWGLGYGLGTEVNIANNTNLNIEALYWALTDGWRYQYISLSQLKFNFGLDYYENKSFFVGPVINVLISDTYAQNYKPYSFAPYAFFNQTSRNGYNVKIWVGINGGVRF